MTTPLIIHSNDSALIKCYTVKTKKKEHKANPSHSRPRISNKTSFRPRPKPQVLAKLIMIVFINPNETRRWVIDQINGTTTNIVLAISKS
jgi:hypothetical protein